VKDVMNAAFLCLGGNMGNRLRLIEEATLLIARSCGSIVKCSSIYETAAWGHSSPNNYLNQVIEIKTNLNAEQLLKKVLAIEKACGRVRSGKRYSNRTMDIDLLFLNDAIYSSKNLEMPHPRLHLRKFVLVPLNECWKNKLHPVLKKTMVDLLKNCKDNLEVQLYKRPLKPLYICIEGNIGSGKTTLAKALSKKNGAFFLPELFEENPLLPLFYGEPNTYAFPLEYSFLLSRFDQLQKALKQANGMVVSDFSIYKCLWFAGVNLAPGEFRLFKQHFAALSNLLPAPDLIVHLKTDTHNLKKNILKRGRTYETGIKDSYLKRVSLAYNKGFNELKQKHILEFEIKYYHPGTEDEIIKSIKKYLKEFFGEQG